MNQDKLNNYLKYIIIVLNGCEWIDARRRAGVCSAPSCWGKSPFAGCLALDSVREKIRTRSIRNKRTLDTKLIDSPAPRLSLRDQQCNDAPLLRHEHVERAAGRTRIHDFETNPDDDA